MMVKGAGRNRINISMKSERIMVIKKIVMGICKEPVR